MKKRIVIEKNNLNILKNMWYNGYEGGWYHVNV